MYLAWVGETLYEFAYWIVVGLLLGTASVQAQPATVSGSVDAADIVAPRLELSSVSGHVEMVGVRSERVEAQSVSGDIEFAGPLAEAGRYELQSHSDDVRVSVGPPYFNPAGAIFTIPMLVVMAVGPLLRWRQEHGLGMPDLVARDKAEWLVDEDRRLERL